MLKPHYSTLGEQFEIPTSKGGLRLWLTKAGWYFATPSGSQGVNLSCADSIRDAFEAEGMDAGDYGY